MIGRALGVALLALASAAAFAQADDEPRVASAEALVAAVAAGGVVWIEPGDYTIDETLVVARDVELREVEGGEGFPTLHLHGAPEGIRIEGGAHARLVGLRLAYASEEPGDVVRVHDARATLENVAIGRAVGVPDPPVGTEGYGRGLYVTGDSFVDVQGGGIGQNGRAAAVVHDTSRLRLSEALLVDNGAGVVAHDDATIGAFDTEFRLHLDFAIAAHGRAVVAGGGNLFEENGVVEGDRLVSAVYVGDRARLYLEGGDTFRDHPGGAFEVAGAAMLTLIGTTVETTGTWSHTYAVGQATVNVQGGSFVGNEGAFYFGEGARAVLEDVVMTGGGAEAIFADGHAFVEVTGGRIEDHADFGLYLDGYARAHVEGAWVARNRSGLVAMGASTLIVRDTDVVDHERTGIGFLDSSVGDATSNRVRGNGWTGVVVAGEAIATVAGNDLEDNAERGAWFDEAGSGRFDTNTVRGSPIGLEVAADAAPIVGTNTFVDVATELLEAE